MMTTNAPMPLEDLPLNFKELPYTLTIDWLQSKAGDNTLRTRLGRDYSEEDKTIMLTMLDLCRDKRTKAISLSDEGDKAPLVYDLSPLIKTALERMHKAMNLQPKLTQALLEEDWTVNELAKCCGLSRATTRGALNQLAYHGMILEGHNGQDSTYTLKQTMVDWLLLDAMVSKRSCA